jgi:hypothetical protein
VSKQVINLLQTFVNQYFRRILKIYWPAAISNQQLWQTTQQEPIELEIKQHKWKWLGHILQRPQTDINHATLELNPQGFRRRGHPTNTWWRTVLNEAKSNGLTCISEGEMDGELLEARSFLSSLCFVLFKAEVGKFDLVKHDWWTCSQLIIHTMNILSHSVFGLHIWCLGRRA